jgi:hypothetical protein
MHAPTNAASSGGCTNEQEQRQWDLASEARQLTDRIGLLLRDKQAPARERLSRIWGKALQREIRRYRVVNPRRKPQARR